MAGIVRGTSACLVINLVVSVEVIGSLSKLRTVCLEHIVFLKPQSFCNFRWWHQWSHEKVFLKHNAGLLWCILVWRNQKSLDTTRACKSLILVYGFSTMCKAWGCPSKKAWGWYIYKVYSASFNYHLKYNFRPETLKYHLFSLQVSKPVKTIR